MESILLRLLLLLLLFLPTPNLNLTNGIGSRHTPIASNLNSPKIKIKIKTTTFLPQACPAHILLGSLPKYARSMTWVAYDKNKIK